MMLVIVMVIMEGRIKLVGGPGALYLVGASGPCVKLTLPIISVNKQNFIEIMTYILVTSSMLSWC